MSVRAEERKSWKKKGGEVAGFKQARFTFTVTSLRLGAAGLLWATSSAPRQSFKTGMQLSQILAPKACLSNGSRRSKTLLRTRTTALEYSTVCWFNWIASACPDRGSIHSLFLCIRSVSRFLSTAASSGPLTSCPFLPPPHPRITQHSQTSNLRPPYIISLQFSPLVKRFPSTDHTHLATCLSLTQEHALSSLFITFLLNTPICSLIFSFLFLKCTIGVGKLGPGHGRGSGTSCRLQRRDSLRA